jgi:hypothetical protein
MTPRIPANPITVIDDRIPPRHPNGDDDDEEEEDDDENGEDKEPPVVREPDEGE